MSHVMIWPRRINLRMSKLMLPLLLLLMSGSWGADKIDPSPCDLTKLPKDILKTLDEKYKEWRIHNIDDLGSYEKSLWKKNHPNKCPGIAVGHFINPQKNDYALMLVPKNIQRGGYWIIVFT